MSNENSQQNHQYITFEIFEKNRNEKFGLLTLNHPRSYNSMSMEMASQFRKFIRKIQAEPDIRALILTGAQESFCSGGNFSLLHEYSVNDMRNNEMQTEQLCRSFLSLTQLEIPTIAAINGPAIGAGATLALAADLRILSAEAKIGFNFSRVGMFPGMATTFLAPRSLGMQNALYLLYTGKIIDAETALRMGFALEISAKESVLERAMEIAAEIAATSPVANHLLKKNYINGRSQVNSIEDALALESVNQAITFATEDFKNAVKTLQSQGNEIKFLGF